MSCEEAIAPVCGNPWLLISGGPAAVVVEDGTVGVACPAEDAVGGSIEVVAGVGDPINSPQR